MSAQRKYNPQSRRVPVPKAGWEPKIYSPNERVKRRYQTKNGNVWNLVRHANGSWNYRKSEAAHK